MAEAMEGLMREQIFLPHASISTQGLQMGANQLRDTRLAQKTVDDKLGSASIMDGFINISSTDKTTPNYSPVPSINDGCHVLHGVDAVKKEKQLKAEADEALNKPPSGETEPPRDQQEKDAVETIVQNTRGFRDADVVARALDGMDKDQIDRVLGAVNKRLAKEMDPNCDVPYKYAQTPDGAVWRGIGQIDGSYKPQTMVRPPDCNVG